MLEIGDKIPTFSLKQTDGTTVKTADWRGKTVVLYFYPQDDTPNCTKEACSLRDGYADIKRKGALLYGISPDDVTSHQKFTEKFTLPFPLLADPGHAIAEKFGVWKEKNMYGHKILGIVRTTFVIGPDLRVLKVIKKVHSAEHAQQLLAVL